VLILVKSSAAQRFDAPAVYAWNKKRCCRNTARRRSENGDNRRILPILLVPGERIELPTNGLQTIGHIISGKIKPLLLRASRAHKSLILLIG